MSHSSYMKIDKKKGGKDFIFSDGQKLEMQKKSSMQVIDFVHVIDNKNVCGNDSRFDLSFSFFS